MAKIGGYALLGLVLMLVPFIVAGALLFLMALGFLGICYAVWYHSQRLRGVGKFKHVERVEVPKPNARMVSVGRPARFRHYRAKIQPANNDDHQKVVHLRG